MHELKAGLNTDKFVIFERFPKRFYHSFVFANDLSLYIIQPAERK